LKKDASCAADGSGMSRNADRTIGNLSLIVVHQEFLGLKA